MLNSWHAVEGEVILHRLGADAERGLAPAESSRRLRELGPNSLHAVHDPPRQNLPPRLLPSLPVLLLLAAAALCARLGDWAAALVAAALAAANALLGSRRERPSWGGGAAFARLSAPAARVVRGGKSFLVPAVELVPGDLVEVSAGDRVPADMRLCRAQRLFVEESALTGASLPVGKDATQTLSESTALAERANMLFAGTLVSAGAGAGVVIATGMRTELGRVARLLGEASAPAPPLRERLAELGQALALGCAVCVAVVAAASRLRGGSTAVVLGAIACLAVATAPAGLPAAVGMALAGAVRRLRVGGTVLRSPATADTLGGVDVLVTDKAGTLTRNELTVRELLLEDQLLAVSGDGHAPEGGIRRGDTVVEPAGWESLAIALRAAALSSSGTLRQDAEGTWRVDGEQAEGAFLTLAAKGGLWRDDLAREHPRLAAFPFTAERRRVTVVVAGRGGRPTAYTRGAPDVVLAHCLHHRGAAGVRPLSPADRERILLRADEMTGRALRVQGLAYREDATGADSRAVERSLVWIGLVGMLDPPRAGIAAAVAECVAAGITPVIVTGDTREAALVLAREIGALLPGDEAICGEELDQLTPEALGACIERYRVCARASAEHKLRVVRAWKSRGRGVAMIGEGVSEAPALREATVGVTLGQGASQVAGEEAALRITAGGLASLVGAVLAGRGVRGNIRRVVAYLLSVVAAESILVVALALVGRTVSVAPLQLLWVGLVAGALPALALGAESPAPAAAPASQRPRRLTALGKALEAQALAGGIAVAAAALGALLLARVWRAVGGEAASGTLLLATLSLSQLVHAFSYRRWTRASLAAGPAGGRGFLGAAALAALLTVAVVQVPVLGRLLGTAPLGRAAWAGIAALALLPLPAVALARAWVRGRPER